MRTVTSVVRPSTLSSQINIVTWKSNVKRLAEDAVQPRRPASCPNQDRAREKVELMLSFGRAQITALRLPDMLRRPMLRSSWTVGTSAYQRPGQPRMAHTQSELASCHAQPRDEEYGVRLMKPMLLIAGTGEVQHHLDENLLPWPVQGYIKRRQRLALAGFAFLAPACLAINMRDGTANFNADSCPSGQELYVGNDNDSYCCPGAVFGESDDDKYCCVGADFMVATPTFASCFPTCTNSAENDASVSPTSTQSCRTTIALTDSAYSSKVAEAVSGGAMTTGSTTTGSTTAGGTTLGGVTSTTLGGGAGAMITSGPMAGLMMVAGGLAMAL
nr:hypothetical protein CFP56_30748 [Quercus suber]